MIRFVCFVTLITVAFSAPSQNIRKERIINGENAVGGEFPYQVSIGASDGDNDCSHMCGGTIISPTAVLTAAHCCDSSVTYCVLAGTTYLPDRYSSSFRMIRASGFTRHENYTIGNDSMDQIPYDICIIHLKESLAYSTHIQPAALPFSHTHPSGSAVLAGWGSTGSTYPDDLQKLNLQIISNSECERKVKSLLYPKKEVNFANNRGVVCTSGRGSGSTCGGDSGSTLVQNGVVIGVVAMIFIVPGEQCSVSNSPTVYAAINHNIEWIYRHTTDLDVKGPGKERYEYKTFKQRVTDMVFREIRDLCMLFLAWMYVLLLDLGI